MEKLIGAQLNGYAESEDLFENLPFLDLLIAVQMSDDRGDACAVIEMIDLVDHLHGPGLEGQFQQHIAALAEAHPLQPLHMGQIGHPGHLGPQNQFGDIFLFGLRQVQNGLRQHLDRFGAALEKTLDIFLYRIKMRSQGDGIDPLGFLGTEHIEAHLHILCAVIHTGQNVGMQIDHTLSFSSGGGMEGAS